MPRHSETIIKSRFGQVSGTVSVVPTDNNDKEALYEELIYRIQVRGFDYLALCSAEGDFETLYGHPIQSSNPEPFVEALLQNEQRVAVGADSDENEVVLFGVDVAHPMQSGDKSTGLIAAAPLEYITDFLSLEDKGQLTCYHIVRPNGSFVIQSPNIELQSLFEELQKHLALEESDSSEENSIDKFGIALKDHKKCAAIFEVNGKERQIYGIPLPYSKWYLVAVMLYGILGDTINSLNSQRMVTTLLSCAPVLFTLALTFLRYYSMTRPQLHELEKARQMALESSKAKSELLANMSHDTRTPTNVIVGMAVIVTTHMNDREQIQSCLRKITLPSKHLLGLINDVPDMPKVESGKLTLTTEQISLQEVTEGIVNIMQLQVKTKKQAFDIHVDNILTENVRCDGVCLNQVLLNLSSNTTKYTPEGRVIRLSLSEEKSPKGENYVRTHTNVKDNGIGMSQDFLKKIYESYSRADSVRVHKTEGADLGMAITKYIVNTMEGGIEVQSKIGKGTEFRITFDFEKAAATKVGMVLPSWNMLVVNDDELLCRTAINALKSTGIKAERTLSGEKAIDLVIRHHSRRDDYRIILLDWKLPGMNGVQVTRELWRNLGDEAPILLISAYDWSEFEAEAREMGTSGFISKPLSKSTLFYALRQCMRVGTSNSRTLNQDMELFGHRTLLAEDNELNWEIVNELLSDSGVVSNWAEDGQICLDKFRKSPEGYYDAILIDIRMPHTTGYEATKAIRGLDHPDVLSVPIIAMGADAFPDDTQHCLKCGMNAHIAKSIDAMELACMLKGYLI